MNVLLTGWSGMLGHYMTRELDGCRIVRLGRSDGSDVRCDLAADVPVLPKERFSLVVHAAGSHAAPWDPPEADADRAMALNLGGTERLLSALDAAPPDALVLVSSHEVYSRDAGEMVDEDRPLWATSKTGMSKALAEEAARRWAERHGVRLTIVRPATMFGSGIAGWAARMFADVSAGRWIHQRGSDGRLSLVTALDVARAIMRLHPVGGTFNLADSRHASWLALAEAMSANSGSMKRQWTLPQKWIATLRRFVPEASAAGRMLSAARMEACARTLTLDNSRALEAGVSFLDTLDVIARKSSDYPYEER